MSGCYEVANPFCQWKGQDKRKYGVKVLPPALPSPPRAAFHQGFAQATSLQGTSRSEHKPVVTPTLSWSKTTSRTSMKTPTSTAMAKAGSKQGRAHPASERQLRVQGGSHFCVPKVIATAQRAPTGVAQSGEGCGGVWELQAVPGPQQQVSKSPRGGGCSWLPPLLLVGKQREEVFLAKGKGTG